MRLNEHCAVRTDRLLLVPYESHHVPRYHEWMSNAELRDLTASEPLTLEEEYKMQRTWREDEDKLTFILLDGDKNAMLGDVNLFLHPRSSFEMTYTAEVEVMIAEPGARGKGLGGEAVLAMLCYARRHLPAPGPACFIAKVGFDNAPSLRLFHRLGFRETRRIDVFREIELQLDAEAETQLLQTVKTYEEQVYDSTHVALNV